jgi:site-specific DNA recombinase
VLEGLQHRLMDPDLMAVFCEEYTRRMNALTREHNAAREGAKAELARVHRDFDRLVQALLDGAPARTVKDRMAQLEARKEVLETQLAQGEDAKVSVHPSMADHYRDGSPTCAKHWRTRDAKPRRRRSCAACSTKSC